jgi:hypothetical protein
VKRQKRLTKREQKALRGPNPATQDHNHEQHIHCVACGRHLDPAQFDGALASATMLRCQHGGQFASCVECTTQSQAMLDTHDRTGQPVQAAAAWH